VSNSSRDDFSEKTKRALAFRANNECSFPSCNAVMSGPSLESPAGYVKSGVAAHIHAAAPGAGARRYLKSMSTEQRSDISNGIWLCRNHANDIDGDEAYYTADRLRAMKGAHEERVTARRRGLAATVRSDFVALGPDLVIYGEVIGADEETWTIRVDDFLAGDLAKLSRFIDEFRSLDPYDQFVAVNALGDGRQLSKPPAWRKTETAYVLTCTILARPPRTRAQDLPRSFALDDAHDVYADKGSWAVVQGLEALPQNIKSSLSLLRGESRMHPSVGTRITEFFKLFRDSSLLASIVKLETIRLACIPNNETQNHTPSTLLRCVHTVRSVQQLAMEPTRRWLPFHFVLEVEGVTELWERDILVLVQAEIGDA
jgi:hypothetical protein